MDEERKLPDTNLLLEDPPKPEPTAPPAPVPTETLPPEPAAESPAAEEVSANSNTQLAPPESLFRRIVHVTLHRILPTTFLVTAVIVYAVLAVTSLAETEFTLPRVLRTMLGEFTGGAENIRFTETSSMNENTVTIESPPVTAESPENPTEPSETVPEPEPSTETAPEPDFPLYRLDMSSSAANGFSIINETPYEVDLNALSEAERAVPTYAELTETYGSGTPVVLILHTHATESYADTYADDFRSQESTNNVTAIGKIVADRLTENGIGVIHCTDLFDYPDFNMAYYNAALAIKRYIADYPSISYIIDIHRDSILSGEGYVRPVTELSDGRSAAQMMFVVGTDHGGSGHTGWRDNLALAARLQKSLHSECPTLTRDINLRSASFNEQYTAGSLLVEIGSCASTIEEVKTTAERFADHLAKEIIG